MCASDSKEKNFFKGLAGGILLTAGLVLFFKTKKGKKTANEIRKKAEEFLETTAGKLEETFEDLEKKESLIIQKAKEAKEEIGKDFEEKKTEVKETISQKLDDSLKKLETAQNQGSAVVSSLKKHFFKGIPKRK